MAPVKYQLLSTLEKSYFFNVKNLSRNLDKEWLQKLVIIIIYLFNYIETYINKLLQVQIIIKAKITYVIILIIETLK